MDTVRLVDPVVAPGVQPDLREHGWQRDDFPALYRELIEPAAGRRVLGRRGRPRSVDWDLSDHEHPNPEYR